MNTEDLIIRPRLNDFHKILLNQEKVDFFIPFVDEDLPLYVDPFLLWKSAAGMDNGLHTSLVDSFNYLGSLYSKGSESDAIDILVAASECSEVGLGTSANKQGKRIGKTAAKQILNLFKEIPQLKECGFIHFEEIQLLVEGISRDRVSDISCSLLSNFIVDYTQDQCIRYGIPMSMVETEIFNPQKKRFIQLSKELPINPKTNSPIWLLPKRWLRQMPWMNPDEFFNKYLPSQNPALKLSRPEIIDYNRLHYLQVEGYTKQKEASAQDLKSDPLFRQIPVASAKRTLSDIKKLSSGNKDKSDKIYEEKVCRLLATLLYPQLDFAQSQSRTESGCQIRDLVFYNNCSEPVFKEIFDKYSSYQLVFELKNVKEISREHIAQVNRYLNDNFGKFGVIVTRNRPSSKIKRHLIDLWSGQRKCILVMSDEDLQLMVDLYDNKQRKPYEVLKKLLVEFHRSCPQ